MPALEDETSFQPVSYFSDRFVDAQRRALGCSDKRLKAVFRGYLNHATRNIYHVQWLWFDSSVRFYTNAFK